MTITCGTKPTNVGTVAMKVLHNSCSMCIFDLTDMYAFALGPVALMLVHTYQSNHLHTCYNYNIYLHTYIRT